MSGNTPTDKIHKDLYGKTVKNSLWVFGLKIFNHILSLLRLAVLAKFLSPNQFGVVGAALLIIEVLETFTQTGFSQSLIQKQEKIQDWLNTAWTVELARSILLYVVIFLLAPVAASIKVPDELIDQTISIIRVSGFIIIIKALANPGTIYFSKDLQFNKVFQINTISNTLGAIVSIAVAVYFKTPWAIVLGKMIGTLLGVIGGYLMHCFRPKLHIDISKVRDMWGFGKWVSWSNILTFLINQGDDFFVWFYLGLRPLGLYQMAYRISTIPGDYVSTTLSTTLFPAMSMIADDRDRLRSAYLKSFKVVFTVSCPFVIALVFGAEFLWLVLGVKWLPAIPIIQLLCIKGFFQTMGTTRGPVFLALAKPNIAFNIKLVRFFILAIIIFPMVKLWGVLGVAGAVVVASIAPQPLGLYWTNRLLDIRLSEYVPLIKHGLILSVVVIILVLAFLRILYFYI